MQTQATQELSFIELADEKLATMLERYPYYTTRSLPKDVYRQDADVTVIGVDNMLIVNGDMDEEQVFQVAQAIYGHMDEFKSNNAIARQIDRMQSTRLPVALHDGAARYFEMVGQGAQE
jgi:TRAP transporter TAXI family solute receptor